MDKPRCHIIALTGGPCSGKTTSIPDIKKDLEAQGFVVLVAHEVATELINKKITPKGIGMPAFQRLVLQHMLSLEDVLKKAAERIMEVTKKSVVILCDRGAMDAAGYAVPGDFERMLEEFETNVVELRDARYDAVVFMRSLAVGAAHLYTCENNSARTETVAEAAELDARLLRAWVGHPHLRIAHNNTDLNGKFARVRAIIHGVLGIGGSLEIENKYLVESFNPAEIPGPCQPIDITQAYLETDADVGVERIRLRGQRDSGSLRFYTVKRELSSGVFEENEERISERHFEHLLGRVNPSMGMVEKIRHCFVYKDQYFELDEFPDGSMLLEIEKLSVDEPVHLPDFLAGKLTDVTGDKYYSNYQIAVRLGRQKR